MSFLKRFSSLQWKLSFSYVVVTLFTVLALEGIVILAMNAFGVPVFNSWLQHWSLDRAKSLARLVVEPLETGSQELLVQVFDQSAGMDLIFEFSIGDNRESGLGEESRIIIDPQGNILASGQPELYPTGTRLTDLELPGVEQVAQVLTDGGVAKQIIEDTYIFVVAAPVIGSQGKCLGVVYYRLSLLASDAWSLKRVGWPLLVVTLALLPCMVPLGLVFGFVTAVSFTRRLRYLTDASRNLAAGDLSRRVYDPSDDEIGQLAQQFNVMAGQLERDTAQLRELADRNARLARQSQQLAVLEERHRLARDLHDGVKQHLFGVNLAVAAALNLLDTDLGAVRVKLIEASEFSSEARAEMRALLNELRPAGLDERGLVAGLTDYLANFEQRQSIEIIWSARGNCTMPLIYEQVLFRVAQEALSNVAHHAQATQVTVELSKTAQGIQLQVVDNGQGFDPGTIQITATRGLMGMQERLFGLGGTLTIETFQGLGTQIVAYLPHPVPTKGEETDV